MKNGRHEYKFQIDEKDIILLGARIGGLMKKDAHAGALGYYQIRSIYFDDFADTCYYQNEAGCDPRAKYRIRIYNADDTNIKLEKKVKQNGMTRKYSVPLSREQAEVLIWQDRKTMAERAGTLSDMWKECPELLKQFLVLVETKNMRPKVMTVYDRTAYVEANGNVRVTFDKNIAASTDFKHFFEEDLIKEPILPAGIHLMEVKYDEFLPAYIKASLDIGHLRQTTFSKYYLCRKRKRA